MTKKNKSEELVEITKFNSVEEWMESMTSRLNWFERNIEIPFYRYFWNYVRDFYYGLLHLPGNIRKWGKFVWNDRDWDSHYTLEALEIKCRAQAKCLVKGYAENCELYAKHALECADALKRLREDEYVDYHFDTTPRTKEMYEDIFKEHEEKRNADLKIVNDSFNEIRSWWD